MTPEQARALFNEHREPGDMAHYGEKAAVAAILAATKKPKEDADEFETVEEWEHDDQRELSLLYNHAAHDRPQFNRIQMRQAIRHGKALMLASHD